MNQIPKKLRDEMEADPFYTKCCITGVPAGIAKIDWHHNLIFAGKQVQEKFAILPLTKEVHDNIVKYKERCNWIMVNKMSEAELDKYSKVFNWRREKERLNKIYGKRSNN
jgi:hypothetical protein